MQATQKLKGLVATKDWIDHTCPDFQKLSVNGQVATSKQAFIDIFGKDKIKGSYVYAITLQKLGNNFALGVVDAQNKKLSGAEWNKNRVTYNNNGYCFDGKAEKTNQGKGFKVGQTVMVTVDIGSGVVQWKVGDQVRHKAASPVLKGSKLSWVPYIACSTKEDSFKITI